MTKESLSQEQQSLLMQLTTALARTNSMGRGAVLGCIVGILKEQGTTLAQVHRFVDKVWHGIPEAIAYLQEGIDNAGEFQVDPSRTSLPETGIYVRATLNGEWGSHDIAHLSRVSLVGFLTSRLEIGMLTCLHLLGHVPPSDEDEEANNA